MHIQGLIDLAPQLSALRLILPQDTLAWRLSLLKQGSQYVEPLLKEVKQRVLLLASERDFLIPSESEAKRLANIVPRCRSKILRGRSHSLLQEAGVNLVDILKVGRSSSSSTTYSVFNARHPFVVLVNLLRLSKCGSLRHCYN